jgi:hypothetical protein
MDQTGTRITYTRRLKRVYSRWHDLMCSLVNDSKWKRQYSPPWCFNERALLGAFTSAIWLSGGKALEEYATSKMSADLSKFVRGRPDLWFTINNQLYYLEAKRCLVTISSNPERMTSLVKCSLNEARQDVRLNICQSDGKKIALVFVIPRLARVKAKDLDKRTAIWSELLDTLHTEQQVDVSWSIYSQDPRKIANATKQYLYPGAAILVKEVR